MNLSWAQLRAVVIVLVFFGINLAYTADLSKEAKEDLDKELKPFTFGYLPTTNAKSTFEYTDGEPKGFRSTEVAASMADSLPTATYPSAVPPPTSSSSSAFLASSRVPGTGCWNQTQECWNNLSWWGKVFVAVFGGLGLLWIGYLTRNTTALSNLTNLLGANSTTARAPASWTGIIMVLVVWAMLVLGVCIFWCCTKGETKAKKKKKKKFKRRKRKQTKANKKMANSPRKWPLWTMAILPASTSEGSPSSQIIEAAAATAALPSTSLCTNPSNAAFGSPVSSALTTTNTGSPAGSLALIKCTAAPPSLLSRPSSQVKSSKAAQSSTGQAMMIPANIKSDLS